MGLFDKFFGGTPKQSLFPAEVAPQLERAANELQLKTGAHDRLFQLGKAAWDVDQAAGTIVFTSPDGVRAVAPVQIVGTFNTGDSTWLWGWDHPSVEPPLAEHAKKMHAYGTAHGLAALTTRKLVCTERDCWDITALTCMICEGQGAYRGPSGPTRVFFTFGSVSLSKSS